MVVYLTSINHERVCVLVINDDLQCTCFRNTCKKALNYAYQKLNYLFQMMLEELAQADVIKLLMCRFYRDFL